jgi:predicted negative regulator of RcsB-dependent stress response
MTSIRTDDEETRATAAERAQTFFDWTRINARLLTGGAVIIVIAAAGYWFYMRSREIQAANAEKQLTAAKQSLSSGNLPLAQSDLQRVVSRYASTPAGVEAAMQLAQLDFDSRKYQDGIAILQKVSGSRAASPVEPTIRSLEGDGYMQMGKAADAAKQYDAAADMTPYETEKAFQRAKAARAYQTAGNEEKAKQIWTSLLNDPKSQTMASEARVRLGELEAKTAK